MSEREVRQALVPNIGADGQARIREYPAIVAGPETSADERDYLERAGVRTVTVDPNRCPAPFRHASFFEHAAPRDLGAGAWRALAQIRKALDGE